MCLPQLLNFNSKVRSSESERSLLGFAKEVIELCVRYGLLLFSKEIQNYC